jgi:hypothetical protein
MATFLERTRALFPYLPASLIRIYADAWDETGNAAVALETMRQSNDYQAVFQGNRRADGTYRYTELEYLGVMDAYRQNLAARGINPELFELHKLIEGDVSPDEHNNRIEQFDTYLRNWGPQGVDGYSFALRYFSEANGVPMTQEAVLASMLDPKIGKDIVARKVSVAQVGGAAAAFGFNRTQAQIERLMGFGVGGEDATDFYARARRQLPSADAMARRFHNPAGGVGIGEFEEAIAGQDPTQSQRLERNMRAEQSSFSRRGTSQRDQDGRLAGLRDR